MDRDRLKSLLREEEGLRLQAYRCPTGHLTIGYGHNIESGGLPPDVLSYWQKEGRITHEMAEALLDADIDAAEAAVRSIFPNYDTLSDARQIVLVDMAFNLGAAGLRKFSRLRAAVLAGDWKRAAEEMTRSRWYQQVGRRARRLVAMMREG